MMRYDIESQFVFSKELYVSRLPPIVMTLVAGLFFYHQSYVLGFLATCGFLVSFFIHKRVHDRLGPEAQYRKFLLKQPINLLEGLENSNELDPRSKDIVSEVLTSKSTIT